MKLWRLRPMMKSITGRSGDWELVRSVSPENAEGWLARFQKDEPDSVFKLSKSKPRYLKNPEADIRKLVIKQYGKPSTVAEGYRADRKWYYKHGEPIEVGGKYVDAILNPAPEELVYGVVPWRQDGYYRLDQAIKTYKQRTAADKFADKHHGVVVRSFDKVTGKQWIRTGAKRNPYIPHKPYLLQHVIVIDRPDLRSPGMDKPAPGTTQLHEWRFDTQKEAVMEYNAMLQGDYDFGSEYVKTVALYKVEPGAGIGSPSTRVVRKRRQRGARGESFVDRYAANPADPDRIAFEYGVVENTNQKQGGWVPMIWKNGVLMYPSWSSIGWDKDEAFAIAKRDVHEEADRYSGDWDISIKERRENPSRRYDAGSPAVAKRLTNLAHDLGFDGIKGPRLTVKPEGGFGYRYVAYTDSGDGYASFYSEGEGKDQLPWHWQQYAKAAASTRLTDHDLRRFLTERISAAIRNSDDNNYITDKVNNILHREGMEEVPYWQVERVMKTLSWEEKRKPLRNPTTGMTAKGRRMEREIAKRGSAYAPSAVVYGKAKSKPGTGLVTKKWASEHGYPDPTRKNPVYSDEFQEGAARAFWSDLYITEVENLADEDPELYDELSPGPGGAWDDYIPEIPESAYKDAKRFENEVIRANNVSNIDFLIAVAAHADGVDPDQIDVDEFGYYLAMPALGHGVSWLDYHADFNLTLPHWEQSVDTHNDMFDFIEKEKAER